ncbi:MAG: class I SAM-dependent methyltransferase [Candidatus Aminicenantes bacterium]|nr:class I SAM-dependent methyltransferase [Candidatus Aminicenantes bacterium]
MKTRMHFTLTVIIAAACFSLGAAWPALPGQDLKSNPNLDKTVQSFLQNQRGRWRDMNVSETDGRVLYNLILEHRYSQALEIGTSTGHSGIWMAWALSKTGGTLITIEIDEDRYLQAVENFKRAGLAAYADARLADAHELASSLPGPFEFVFVDADKDWYANYLKLLWPKLKAEGRFTAHNVLGHMSGIREFLNSARNLPDAETVIDQSSGSGMSITYKRAAK